MNAFELTVEGNHPPELVYSLLQVALIKVRKRTVKDCFDVLAIMMIYYLCKQFDCFCVLFTLDLLATKDCQFFDPFYFLSFQHSFRLNYVNC